MQFNIYSVRDEKASAFIPPIFFVNDAEAIRAFGDAVVNPKSGFNRHPEDYSFHCLGTFDDVSGLITGCTARYLCRAMDFIKPVVKDEEVK